MRKAGRVLAEYVDLLNLTDLTRTTDRPDPDDRPTRPGRPTDPTDRDDQPDPDDRPGRLFSGGRSSRSSRRCEKGLTSARCAGGSIMSVQSTFNISCRQYIKYSYLRRSRFGTSYLHRSRFGTDPLIALLGNLNSYTPRASDLPCWDSAVCSRRTCTV